MNFDMNFTYEKENILEKAASDERMINYNNLFFKTGGYKLWLFQDLVHCMIY